MLGIQSNCNFSRPLTYTYLKPVPGLTNHPKNHLNYLKFHSTIQSVHGSGLLPFVPKFVDGEEVLRSGETWVNGEGFALLR